MLTGERRTIPGETVEQVEEELHAIAGEAALRIIASRDPLTADPTHPFAELVRGTADAGDYIGALFWTDAALFAGAGIPTVLFGPSAREPTRSSSGSASPHSTASVRSYGASPPHGARRPLRQKLPRLFELMLLDPHLRGLLGM